ncbi:tetratricopeptide repeat protein 37 [Anopheles arabiensis]|uniref:Tetratricopeptide repeat protein 37 n=1 Tax=Anopheles arabiensis TaxID=7173 RepID=A0A182HJE0_ANOAR|nr:tetratricopeptide repeat protein 37 [Anopheles arabiensis]
MSSKEAKAALKEAREAVKNKKFSDAIKLCNKVLKEQSDNYMALLLLGASYQDSDKKEAATYLRRAVSCSAEPPIVALQGLVGCADDTELPDVCEKLLTLTPDKFADLHAKLFGVAARGTLGKALRLLEREATDAGCEETRRASAFEYLGKLVAQYSELEIAEPALVGTVLEREIRNDGDVYQHDKFNRYLKLLHREKRYDRLAAIAAAMHERFPNDIYPLEWICKLYSERIVPEETLSTVLTHSLEHYFDRALAIAPKSPTVLLAKGKLLYEAGKLSEAERYLRRANEIQPLWSACMTLLAEIYFRQKAYGLAENLYRNMKVQSRNYAIALMQDESEEKLREANRCFATLYDTDRSVELLFNWCKTSLLLGEHDAAEQRMGELEQTEIEPDQLDYLRALREKITGNVEKAIEILSRHPASSICLLELSLVLDGVEGRRDDSFLAALQATKLDPNNAACFYRLGKLYQQQGDALRARKCLEKSVHLSPAARNAVILLSGLYRRYNEWDANAALLSTTFSLCSGAAWAQLLLGLHHLGRQEYDEAIGAFRTVLRYEVNNPTAWEGLADAYLGRGSYSSAMKLFEKITERDPDNPYPLLQLANIKNTVKQHRDGLELFEQLLARHENYFPAIKGVADSHMGLCFYRLGQRLVGRSRDHAQACVEHLTRAIKMKPNFLCLWHQLGKVLDTVAAFPSTHSHLSIEGSLAGSVQHQRVLLKRNQLSELAARCYGRIVKQNPDNSVYWYELAANHFRRAMELAPANADPNGTNSGTSERVKMLYIAQDMAKQAIKLDPARWQNWNLLGVICATGEVNNLALAQHCFVEAVTVDRKTAAAAWNNLGVLYLGHGPLGLANKAFGRAQQCDTTFMNAWIGQAMIAERVGQMDEAMDLFRHCTQLGYHREAALGYAHWVCSIVNEDNYHENERYRFAIDAMAALPVAHDAIGWHCADLADRSSVVALRFLGNLSSRLGLWRTASDAYGRAAQAATNPATKDQILCDLGHCLTKQGRHVEAVQCYERMRGEPGFRAVIGRAQAYFRAAQYEQSYAEYELGLNHLAKTDAEKAYVLIAMSAMVYAFHGQDAARTVLFQCIAQPQPPIEALFSACALGLLHKDAMLTDLVIKELRKHEDDPVQGHHVVFFVSEFYWQTQQPKQCYTYLLSQMHRYPHRPKLWQVLAMTLLKRFRTSANNLRLACNVAQGAVTLDLADRKRRTRAGDAARWLAVASEAIRPVDNRRCRILAQQAVHADPTNREAWGAFLQMTQ